jgi:hypothetical protein
MDVRAIIDAIETEFDPSALEHCHNRPGTSEVAASGGGNRSNLNIDASTNPSRRDRKGKGRAQSLENSLDNRIQTSIIDTPTKQRHGPIGCPFYQRAKMLRPNERPPGKCTGCHVESMSACRAHFHPKRVARHRDVLAYYEHCETCRRDFVDPQRYKDHHGTCVKYPIPRNNVEIQWIPLCLTLFPHDVDVASPCKLSYARILSCLYTDYTFRCWGK